MAQVVTDEELARINELAHISKERDLTPEEKEEQRVLRAKYLAEFRKSMRGILNSTSIQQPDGTITRLADKQKKQF